MEALKYLLLCIQVFLLILTLAYEVKGHPQHNDEYKVIPNGFSECDDVTPCEEGYSCHPSQGLCYKDPAPVNRPHVWLGKLMFSIVRQQPVHIGEGIALKKCTQWSRGRALAWYVGGCGFNSTS